MVRRFCVLVLQQAKEKAPKKYRRSTVLFYCMDTIQVKTLQNPGWTRSRGRAAVDTIAMPLDPAFGFAMVGVFFEDWRSHEIYSYAGNVQEVLPVKNYELGGKG